MGRHVAGRTEGHIASHKDLPGDKLQTQSSAGSQLGSPLALSQEGARESVFTAWAGRWWRAPLNSSGLVLMSEPPLGGWALKKPPAGKDW